jgi:hypothetical protein
MASALPFGAPSSPNSTISSENVTFIGESHVWFLFATVPASIGSYDKLLSVFFILNKAYLLVILLKRGCSILNV